LNLVNFLTLHSWLKTLLHMHQEQQPRKKSEKRQRTEFIRARVTPEMKQEFLRRCADAGLSSTDYIRRKCLDETPLRKVPRVRYESDLDLSKVLAHLGKWGSNVNQIAHAINIALLQKEYSTTYAEQTLRTHQQKFDEILLVISECRDMIREKLLTGDITG
ncbi:MAG: plasmid mobilization relaxosome protein MobC, partial [Bacteroidota bacterium]